MRLTLVLLMILMFSLFAVPCAGQETAPTTDLFPATATSPLVSINNLNVTIPETPSEIYNRLYTLSGIVGLSILLTQGIRWLLKDTVVVDIVPLWLAAPVAITLLLTLLANLVLKTLPGEPLALLWQGMLNAAGASGIFSWGKKMVEDAKKDAKAGKIGTSGRVGVFLALAGVVGLMGGCAGMSPSQKYKIASDTYSTTLNVLADMNNAGYIPLADARDIDTLRKSANVSLDKMRDAVLANNPISAEWYYQEIDKMLNELIRVQMLAEARKAEMQKKAPAPAVPVKKETSYDDADRNCDGFACREGSPDAGAVGSGHDRGSGKAGPGPDPRRDGPGGQSPGSVQREVGRLDEDGRGQEREWRRAEHRQRVRELLIACQKAEADESVSKAMSLLDYKDFLDAEFERINHEPAPEIDRPTYLVAKDRHPANMKGGSDTPIQNKSQALVGAEDF